MNISPTQLNLLLIASICHKYKSLSIAPNLISSNAVKKILSSLGLFRFTNNCWQSGVIDLEKDVSELRQKVESRFRNSLKKSINCGVVIKKINPTLEEVNALLERYSNFVANKKFVTISPCILKSLLTSSNIDYCANLYSAFSNGEYLGDLVSIRTGSVETYLIGQTNVNGRGFQANTALLWESIISAKKDGVSCYDLGGIPLGSMKLLNIVKFKMSLNPKLYCLTGEWLKFY
jgi:lipid II:glycine glycyltransferase (peptidoglycan interpeptide bridge formation enzyme)